MVSRMSEATATEGRVFVSSVIDGFEEYRKAAADGIELAGCEAVMVERFPALAASPRNACLDGVQASDACIVIVGSRGGWTTPSGALAVEEEFDEAQRRAIPILVFLQQVERDEQAVRLERRLSDYVAGQFRKTFMSAEDLRAKVQAAVRSLGPHMNLPHSDSSRAISLLEADRERSYETALRFALVPERAGELVPPDRLEAAELVDEIYRLGHDPAVRFFDYSCPKKQSLSDEGSLRIEQSAHAGKARLGATLSLSETGELVLESDIRGGEDSGDPIRSMMVLVEDDLVSALRTEFALAARLLDHLDPYERFSTAWIGSAVVGIGHRYLVPKRLEGGSTPVRMGDEPLVVAESTPRRVSRPVLRAPDAEIQRLLALFRRKLGRDRSGR
jgi:hypothetical protein